MQMYANPCSSAYHWSSLHISTLGDGFLIIVIFNLKLLEFVLVLILRLVRVYIKMLIGMHVWLVLIFVLVLILLFPLLTERFN